MKKMFEILLVISVFTIIIYSLVYIFYFNSLCEKYSWNNESNYSFAITKLANCKDSIICYSDNIKVNRLNEITDWNCIKKESSLFGKELYIEMFNNLKNSIIK